MESEAKKGDEEEEKKNTMMGRGAPPTPPPPRAPHLGFSSHTLRKLTFRNLELGACEPKALGSGAGAAQAAVARRAAVASSSLAFWGGREREMVEERAMGEKKKERKGKRSVSVRRNSQELFRISAPIGSRAKQCSTQ